MKSYNELKTETHEMGAMIGKELVIINKIRSKLILAQEKLDYLYIELDNLFLQLGKTKKEGTK